jgi:hypothetical protein
VVGAALGALHGRAALPQNWIDALLGRTTANDHRVTLNVETGMAS